MMTGVATLEPQRRHGLGEATAAREAAWRDVAAPSLMPTSGDIHQRIFLAVEIERIAAR
jgi:hypothetical protein